MRITVSLLAATTLAASLSAQNANHALYYYPEGRTQTSTSFTSRSGIGAGQRGDMCTWFHKDFFVGVGGLSASSGSYVNRIHGFNCIMQDQDAATLENFSMALIPGDAGNPGKPNFDENATVVRVPASTPPGVTGIAAWRIVTTLNPAVDLPQPAPGAGLPGHNYHVAFGVEEQSLWTADGISLHMTIFGTNAGTTAWDFPKLTWPNSGFTMPQFVNGINRTTLTPGGPPNNPGVQGSALGDRTHHIGLLVDDWAPTLNMGGVVDPVQRGGGDNPSFGVGGSLPDHTVARADGIAARVDAPMVPNAPYLVIAGLGVPGNPWTPFAISLNDPFRGSVLFNFGFFIELGQGTLDAAGFSNATLIPQGTNYGPTGAIGAWGCQAFVLDVGSGLIWCSNGSGFFSES